jgi:type IV secretory pathway ATPase VirB11/archaellum biosynthesis ATPase
MIRIPYQDAPAALLFYLSGAAYGTAAGIVSALPIPEPRRYVLRVLKVQAVHHTVAMMLQLVQGRFSHHAQQYTAHSDCITMNQCLLCATQNVWDNPNWGGHIAAEVPVVPEAAAEELEHSMLPIVVCGGPQSGKTTLLSWWSTGRR